jgi:hypothetical protein
VINIKEKTGFITPEKVFKRLFLWGLIATLISGLFAYLDYSSHKNARFNQLLITEGTLVEGFYTALLKTYDNKIIYFPRRSGGKYGGRSYYPINLKEFYNRRVKIWWYSNKPFEPLYQGNYIYQMEVEGKLVLTYAEQKARFSRNKYFISTLSATGAILLFLFGIIGYISSKDIKGLS